MTPSPAKPLPEGVLRVTQVLRDKGHPHAAVMLSDAARTAQQAADALGIQLGQIAKSIIFKRKPDEVAVLVITSGDRRVDEKKVQALVCAAGQKLGRADAEWYAVPRQDGVVARADVAEKAFQLGVVHGPCLSNPPQPCHIVAKTPMRGEARPGQARHEQAGARGR